MKIKIITPLGILFSTDCAKSITLPSISGQITIMNNHTTSFLQIISGITKIIFNNLTKNKNFELGKGIIFIGNQEVLVLVEN